MMDQPNNPVYPPRRPAGSRSPSSPTEFLDAVNQLHMEFTLTVDRKIMSMFQECFKAGEEFNEAEHRHPFAGDKPDFEMWFDEALKRWRNA